MLLAGSALCGAVHAESVYKYDGADGATTYSDRPEAGVAAEVEKVQLPAGPSQADQRAAEQRVQQMQESSAEMEQSRLANQEARERQKTIEGSTASEEPVGGWSTVDPRRDPKARIPLESPTGGEHPIYQPGIGPGNAPGIPRGPVARPARGR
jgi:hypothetical protein